MRLTYLTVGLAFFCGIMTWLVSAGQSPIPRQSRSAPEVQEHGAYLVQKALLCGDCHTPKDQRGQPDAVRALQGTVLPIQPKKKTGNWAERSPDITFQGLAGKWSEGEMVRFLMTGIDPDGKKARAPMPPFRLNAKDAHAVARYLRSLPGSRVIDVLVPTKVGPCPDR